jgi:MscS family membrane protein
MRTIAARFIAVLASLLTAVAAHAGGSGDWAGQWDLRWNGGSAFVKFTQDGATVTGEVELLGSRIKGGADGGTLVATRSEGGRAYALRLVLEGGGSSFIGRDEVRGWVTGKRVRDGDAPEAARLDSPRAAFVEFVFAATQVRLGHDGYWPRVVKAAEFTPSALAQPAEERLQQLREFIALVELTTFRYWEVPPHADGDRVSVALERLHPAGELPIEIHRNEAGAWRVAIPDRSAIEALRKSLVAGAALPSQQSFRKLQSPRDCMHAFLAGMVDWHRNGRALAVSALDLSELPEALRDTDGELAAGYIGHALQNIGFDCLQSVSDDPTNRDPCVLFEHPEGSIVIAPSGPAPDAPWRFSAATVANARRLDFVTRPLAGMQPRALGSPPSSPYFAMRDFVGAHAPVLLARRLGFEAWQALALLVLLVASFVAGRVAAMVGFALMRRASGSVEPDTALVRGSLWALATGLMLAPVPGLLAIPHRYLLAVMPVAGALLSVAAAIVAWHLVSVGCDRLARVASRTSSSADDLAVSLLRGCLRVGVVAGACVVAAYFSSIPATHVLAGLGIGGIGIAFASQQTIAQFFGAGVLVGDRAFGVGDWIQCNGGAAGTLSGVVEGVGFRSTRIRSADGSVLAVPNAALAAVTIVNLGPKRPRPLGLQLTVTQGATLDRVERFIASLRERMAANPAFIAGRTTIGVSGVGRDGIMVQCNAFLDAKDDGAETDARHAFLVEILAVADEHGLGLGPQLVRGDGEARSNA